MAGRRVGLAVLCMMHYGSGHEGTYRRYRGGDGREHEKSCCPLQPAYLERHIFQYAVRAAENGADGVLLDFEMYGSDSTSYPGPCFCDACFRHYLRNYSTNWRAHDGEIAPQDRGRWINDQKAIEHYGRHAAARIERQWDALRARCQAIRPTFLFAYAPFLEHIPGMTCGLGTPDVPCLVLSEREYGSGPPSSRSPSGQTWTSSST